MSGTAASNPPSNPQESLAPLRALTSGAIENQLAAMWRQVSSADLAAGGAAVARASVMTLVAYAENPARGKLVEEVISDLIAQMAARAIVLMPTPAQPASPSIEVALYIKDRDANNNAGHGEEVLIRAHDDAVWHLAGAVLPLVLSGLPAFLWWTGEPPWHTELLESLVDGCDRLIVDGSEVSHVERSLVRLAELVSRKKHSCAVTDLNWRRQRPWRELIAQFFDAPSVRPYLYGIDRVTIEYAAGAEGSPTNPAQAYLLTGWLASRLGWTPYGSARLQGVEPARECTLVSPQGGAISVEMNPRFDVPIKPWIEIVPKLQQALPQGSAHGAMPAIGESGAACAENGASLPTPRLTAVGPGALMSVHLHANLHTATGDKSGTFTVAREADLETASLLCHADCAVPSQTCHLPALGELEHLKEQLQLLDHDAIYEQAIAMASRLIAPVAHGGRRSTP